MTRCSTTALSRMRTLYLVICSVPLVVPIFSLVLQQHLSLSCMVTTARWNLHWKPFWVPYGDGFKKAHMEEWEQEARASKCSSWEPGQRWTEPGSWSWINQDLTDEETFAFLPYEASGLQWYSLLIPSNIRTMAGALLVIHHQFLQVYPLRRNHLGNRIQIQIHQEARRHSEDMSSKVKRTGCGLAGDRWASGSAFIVGASTCTDGKNCT